MPEQIQANRRRATLLVAGSAAAVFVLAAAVLGLLLGPLGLLPALVVAAAPVWFVVTSADAAVLSRLSAEPADPVGHARLHNLVEGLCAGAGITKPALWVLDDPAPNACAVGRDPRRASLVVTSGLLEKLNRIELEGVLAHELSHVKSHDIVVSTVAVALFGRFGVGAVASAVGTRRETSADVTGVALTRYPPGLISALEKLRDDAATLRSSDPAVAHLWIEAPSAVPSHPPLEERIQALREL